MTIKSKPKTRWEKIVAWDEKRRFGVEVTLSDIRKLERLDKILRKDMDELGIKQIAISINPKNSRTASAYTQVLRIKGKDKRRYPNKISFDYSFIQKLNVQELRSIAWHEFGHYIFQYYYPEIALRSRKTKQHHVTESFADEFAYRKFGDVYISAGKKIVKVLNNSRVDFRIRELEDMKDYINQYGYGYWKGVARECGVSVKYDPKNSIIMGVKPKAGVLGNLR